MSDERVSDKNGEGKPLIEDMDASRWAREFDDMLAKQYNVRVDQGWLVSWFANAIMCGYDVATRRFAPSARGPLTERDPQAEDELVATLLRDPGMLRDYVRKCSALERCAAPSHDWTEFALVGARDYIKWLVHNEIAKGAYEAVLKSIDRALAARSPVVPSSDALRVIHNCLLALPDSTFKKEVQAWLDNALAASSSTVPTLPDIKADELHRQADACLQSIKRKLPFGDQAITSIVFNLKRAAVALDASHRRAEAFKEAMHSYEQAARVEQGAPVSAITPQESPLAFAVFCENHPEGFDYAIFPEFEEAQSYCAANDMGDEEIVPLYRPSAFAVSAIGTCDGHKGNGVCPVHGHYGTR